MLKHLPILPLLLLLSSTLTAQTIYEDFEGTPLGWNATFGDGTFNGVIDNPDPNFVNDSEQVGSYTKSDMTGFSLLIATLDAPMDLTTDNQFSIDVYAPVASSFIFKLEGDGVSQEYVANIPLAEVWYHYSFDFSDLAGATTVDKIVIFFDNGNAMSADTYLFDNIVADPAGPCAGVPVDPAVIDDFECQRNATYGGGFEILEVIDNPDPSGINTSGKVGQYTDPLDEFSALVIDYGEAIDLMSFDAVSAKIWAPKTGNLLFKLEGGVSPPFEVSIPVTQTNTWVEYVADFSSQSNANHTRLAIFFNAGVTAEDGDLYYIDDIEFTQAPPAAALEDFEMGASLGWMPLNGNTMQHGSFAVIANPDMSGENESENVGRYTKGNAAFSTVTTFLPMGLDLSSQPQLNLQVWSPVADIEVTMSLVSALQGNKEVTRTVENAMEWTTLNFNFEEFSDLTDFERINVLFNPGTAAPGTIYYFDNLTQGSSTVDPCEDAVVKPNVLDDYECQRNATYVAGEERLAVVPNPDVSPENSSTTVGEYTDVLDQFSALVLTNGGSFDLSLENQFHIKVWAPVAGPMLVKLEGGSSPAEEVTLDITETMTWVDYVVDFSDQMNADHQQIAIFFNAGITPSAEDVYYIDDLFFSRDSYRGCVATFETGSTGIENFQYFANGSLEAMGKQFEIVDNPNQSGINTSDRVGEFVKAGDALPFAGMFAALDAPINFGSNKTIRAKVHMDHIGNFAVKIEGSTTGADAIEIAVDNTVTGEWEELTFDFSAAPDGADYRTLTIFFDLGIDATGENVTSYFDDIVIGDGSCTTVGVFAPNELTQFVVAPNPVSDRLRVELPSEVRSLLVTDLYGRTLRTVAAGRSNLAEIDVTDLPNGVYLLSGFDRSGALVASGRFVRAE